MYNRVKILLPTAIAVIVLDQVTKTVLLRYLYQNQVVEAIPGLFNIVYFKNTGAAFGIFSGGGAMSKLFLLAVTLGALVVLGFLLKESKGAGATFALSLIVGGAIGNLIDRLLFGYVVDFLDFHLGTLHWPAFNVADSAITVGVGLTIYFMYFKKQGQRP
ncbi:MAG: signal peptidase II [Thermodesulfobacteriota bacterium]